MLDTKPSPNLVADHRLRVGIDFGTTFSGVAWTDSAKPGEVAIITDWPGGSGSHEKVPSEISYTSAGAVHKWGYELRPGEERFSWIKLLLKPEGYLAASSDVEYLIPTPSTKKPIDLIADYLRCLREHTLATIKRRYGAAFLKATPIDYVLTVPAIWTDSAKSLTLQAAELAGFGSRIALQLISEPDAAAAWTLLRDLKLSTLKVKDAFVVADCGGGTVDLISYEVVEDSPLIVRECAVGTGGLCGSTFLNKNFEQLVRSRIGKRFDKMKLVPRNRLMKAFEEDLKRGFSNSEDDDIFTVPIGGVRDDPVAGIEDGGFIVTREEMKGIFDPVIDQIVLLVLGQIKAVGYQAHRGLRLSAILLVGGFGASRYLLQRLETELGIVDRHQPPIEILQPDNAWSAVARGAALGMHVSNRTARRHYGTDCTTAFVTGKHPIKNLFYSPYTGEPLCDNYMTWYIKRGDQVSEDTPISIPFTHNVAINETQMVFGTLYEFEGEEAPNYSNQPGKPVGELCKLIADLSMVPKDLFTRKIGPNAVPYYHVSFNLIMTVKSAMMIVFQLEFGGKKYGSVAAEYS